MNNPTPAVLHRSLFLHALPFGLLGFLLPIIGRELGATAVEIGGLFSIYSLALLLMRPLSGWLLDKKGRRVFFVLGIGGSALVMLLYGFTLSVPTLFVARICQGVAAALLTVATNTLVGDLAATNQRGLEMGRIDEVQTRGEMLGIFIGFTIFGFLGEGTLGWRFLFSFYAGMIGIAAYLAWRNVPETLFVSSKAEERKVENPPLNRKFLQSKCSCVENGRFVSHIQKRANYRFLAGLSIDEWFEGLSSGLLRLMSVVFVRAISLSMLAPIFLIYLQDRITSDMMLLAWAFFPSGIVFSILPSWFGRKSDSLRRVPLMASGMIIAGLFSFVIPLLDSLLWLALANLLVAVGWAAADPAEAALVADLSQNVSRGRTFGWYAFAGSLGAIVGPLMGGWVYGNIGQTVPFYLNGLLLLITSVLAFALLTESDNTYVFTEQ